MSLPLLPVILLVALVMIGSPPAPAPNERLGFSPGGIFLVQGEISQRNDAAHMVEAGGKWVRLDVDWSRIERVRGTFDWSATDRAVRIARDADLEVIGLAAYTPSWARPAGTTSMWPPGDDTAFARFAAAAAARYSDDIDVWEIWNEPNLRTFWASGPDPERYTRLLTAGADAIRRERPSATILLGGLAVVTDKPRNHVDPVTFLRRVYAAGGRRSFDGVSAHPYTYPYLPSREPTGIFSRLTAMYDILSQNDDADKGIWITEFGAPTGDTPRSVSPETQAAVLADGLALARRKPWIQSFLVFSLRDAGTDPSDEEQNFGLRNYDGSPKFSWWTYPQETYNH